MADRAKAEVVWDLFGVNIAQQGRGFYVPLELLAIVRGVVEFDPDQLLDPDVKPVQYKRSSHDLARRIAVGAEIERSSLAGAVDGDEALDTLHALTSSLLVEIPGRRNAPTWFNAHLYPFVGELIHYDAVYRRGKAGPWIERYTFRDGGGWAYNVLRNDSNGERRESTAAGLRELVGDSRTPLGRVADSLKSHDSAPNSNEVYTDESEGETLVFDHLSPWPEHLRRGVNYIVTRGSVPKATRIESLMHWVPYCLARHQLHLARHSLGLDREVVFVDFNRDASALRRRSQNALDGFRKDIVNALIERAKLKASEAQNDVERERYERLARPGTSSTGSPRSFFSESLAAVGALNSTAGKRHFTFKPPMLEALVAATLKPGVEVEFYAFCRRVFEEYGIVIDERTASEHDLTIDVDGSEFGRNALAFRDRLLATGLLTHYSDATSIVHGEHR
ncbi:hypothetical protein [Promicromonospora sp. NPDC023805]|uniref:hypothetical protein n=1 Tax=Promicromonospora sp. NPDC023805 TaxID=3154696 RepID=UPI003404FEC3